MRALARRGATCLGVVVLMGGGVVSLLPGDAAATEQPVVTVAEGAPQKVAYGPIPLQNPALAVLVTPTPEDCALPGFCDVVPVEVTKPANYDPELTYLYTSIELNWTQPSESNDLDMYVYADDPEDPGTMVQVNSSASSAKPEKTSAENFKFWVVVNNYYGANDGYELTLTVNVERLGEPPFEALEPPPPPGSAFGGGSGVGAGATAGGGGGSAADLGGDAAFAPNFAGTPTAPFAIDLAPVDGTNPFDVVGEADDSGPPLGAAAQVDLEPIARAEPVGSGVVLTWLLAVPLVLLMGAALWVNRRAPRVLRTSPPTTA